MQRIVVLLITLYLYSVSGKIAYGCHVYYKPGAWKRQRNVNYVIHRVHVSTRNEWRLGVWQSDINRFEGNIFPNYRLYKSINGGRKWTKLIYGLEPCPAVRAIPASGAARSNEAAAGAELLSKAFGRVATTNGLRKVYAYDWQQNAAMKAERKAKLAEDQGGEGAQEGRGEGEIGIE